MQEQDISSKQYVPIPDATWENAVIWLRQQADQQELVRACYFDDPPLEAARRFAESPEWRALTELLPSVPATALDIGAGRGISSYALAQAGWNVTALEPDPSSWWELKRSAAWQRNPASHYPLFRATAKKCRSATTNSISSTADRSYTMPEPRFTLREVCRVLKPRGRFVATRDHVISSPEDLKPFLHSASATSDLWR